MLRRELYAHKDHNDSDKSNFSEKILGERWNFCKKTLQIPELATVLTQRYSHSRMGSILLFPLQNPSQISFRKPSTIPPKDMNIELLTQQGEINYVLFEFALPSQPQP